MIINALGINFVGICFKISNFHSDIRLFEHVISDKLFFSFL